MQYTFRLCAKHDCTCFLSTTVVVSIRLKTHGWAFMYNRDRMTNAVRRNKLKQTSKWQCNGQPCSLHTWTPEQPMCSSSCTTQNDLSLISPVALKQAAEIPTFVYIIIIDTNPYCANMSSMHIHTYLSQTSWKLHIVPHVNQFPVLRVTNNCTTRVDYCCSG